MDAKVAGWREIIVLGGEVTISFPARRDMEW